MANQPAVGGAAISAPAAGASLAVRTAIGTAWMIAWRFGARGLGLVSTLVLVRILAPEDFGLIALAFSVSQSVELLTVFGIEEAVVRHPKPTRLVYDTAFTLNVLRGLITASVIAAAAWPMAVFFAEPRLTVVILALALAITIAGFRNIGMVDYRRDLRYDIEFRLRLLPRLLAMAASLSVAILFRSYWALVVAILVERLATSLMTYTLHPYRPRFALAAWRELASFSLWTWVLGLITMVRDRTGSFVVGRLLGMPAVGIMSIAVEIAILPLSELMMPLYGVLFTALSQTTHDRVRSTALYLRFLGLAMLITVPAGVGIAILAEPLTYLLLGPQWLEAVPLIQIIGAFGPLAASSVLSRALLDAYGMMRSHFLITAFTTILRVAFYIGFVYKYGLVGAAWAIILPDLVDQCLILGLICRRFSISLSAIVSRIWRPLLGSLVMAAGLLELSLHTVVSGSTKAALVTQTLLCVAGGAALFTTVVVAAWLAARRPDGAEADVMEAARRLINRLRARPSFLNSAG